MSEIIRIKPKIYGDYKISDENIVEVKDKNPNTGFSKITIDVRLSTLELPLVIKLLNNATNCLCTNYEDALYISELVNRGLIKVANIKLEDDLEMKDRSYIDFSQFKSVNLIIPTSYFMWGVKNIDDTKTSMNQRTITEATRVASMIAEFPEHLSDIEKIILVVNYIQNYCEYINNRIDELHRTGEQFELKDDLLDKREVINKLCHQDIYQVGTNAEEPLFENYGTCSGFSELMVLLLNNPYLKIRCELVSGEGHSWNVVLLDGKYYNIDVTRSINYSPYRTKNNLKTTQFNKDYILVGTDYLDEEEHEKRATPLATSCEESKIDFNQDYIYAAIEHLQETGLVQFEYANDNLYPRESSPLKK